MSSNVKDNGSQNGEFLIEQNEEYFFSAANTSTKDALASSLSTEEYINEVDRLYYRAALHVSLAWMVLAILSYIIGWDSLEKLEGLEQTSAITAALLLGMCFITNIIPQLLKVGMSMPTGIVVCALTVHLIAFLTEIILGFFPVPVMLNPLSETRVFLLRWSEWAPLAYLMTLLTDSCRKEGFNSDNSSSSGERISSLLSVMRKEYKKNNSSTVEERISLNTQNSLTRSRANSIGEDEDYSTQFETLTRDKDQLREEVWQEILPSYRLAWCQGLSTLCGWFFPMVSSPIMYMLLLSVSLVLYSSIIVRAYRRGRMLMQYEPGKSSGQREMYMWEMLSFRLLLSCSVLWTILVTAYFCYTLGPILFPSVKFFQLPYLSMVVESIIDVLYKALYMIVVADVNEMIFDPKARTGRRLEELRQMIGVVWENSSDVICISVKGATGDVTTLLSPTYLKLYSGSAVTHEKDEKNASASRAVAFDIDASVFDEVKDISDRNLKNGELNIVPSSAYDVNFDRDSAMFAGRAISGSADHLSSMAVLIARAWKAKEETKTRILMHDLTRMDSDGPQPVRCEANISVMEENVAVIVVRDISERFRRFEAEKKVISETTARRKDAAANRFTRHEVKNGLLAAIGLCDSLNDFSMINNVHFEGNNHPGHTGGNHHQENTDLTNTVSNIALGADSNSSSGDSMRYVSELGKTLKEILDTVLAEAMARDVIHEVYEPKLEKVNLPDLLAIAADPQADDTRSKRYPIYTNIAPFPEFSLDTQLWKYIHRNAVSNACKYGKASGTVTTNLHWDESTKYLKLEVINLPGENHEAIMELGERASELIFSPRKRLSVHTTVGGNNHASASHSAGDGAWIMHKCAKTLGGECTIKFEPERTVFTFQCPASLYDETANLHENTTFKLPSNVYAIAIDDSKIQRQLLKKFFDCIKIPSDRSFIQGKSAAEITGFNDWALNFIYNHPNDYFLFIVDENLVIQDDEFSKHVTISGSMSISNLRSKLLPDQEKRVLALIRSANDSARDIAIYNSRAHGYISKEPIRGSACLDAIAPHWIARFPKLQRLSSETLLYGDRSLSKKRQILKNASWELLTKLDQGNTSKHPRKRPKKLYGLKRRKSNGNGNAIKNVVGQVSNVSPNPGDKRPLELENLQENLLQEVPQNAKRMKESASSDDSEMSEGLTITDCWESIEDIDEYLASDRKNNPQDWKIVWGKLHALKGDLLMIDKKSENLEKAIAKISELKGQDFPNDFSKLWHELRMLLCS